MRCHKCTFPAVQIVANIVPAVGSKPQSGHELLPTPGQAASASSGSRRHLVHSTPYGWPWRARPPGVWHILYRPARLSLFGRSVAPQPGVFQPNSVWMRAAMPALCSCAGPIQQSCRLVGVFSIALPSTSSAQLAASRCSSLHLLQQGQPAASKESGSNTHHPARVRSCSRITQRCLLVHINT